MIIITLLLSRIAFVTGGLIHNWKKTVDNNFLSTVAHDIGHDLIHVMVSQSKRIYVILDYINSLTFIHVEAKIQWD